MLSVTFQIATSAEALAKALAVREIVFCGEQGIAYAIEHDDHDADSLHVLGEQAGAPIAAGRIRFVDDYAKLERIAVLKEQRGKGDGRALTEFMLALAHQRGFTRCRLNAQAHLVHFYAAHGFRPCGPHFLEADIDHCPMLRDDTAR